MFFNCHAGGIRHSRGFLLLLSDRLVFRSRLKRSFLEISAARMVNVYHDRIHKNIDLHQSVIKVDFFTQNKIKDTAAFKVPYPPQWIDAIQKAFSL